LERSSSSSVTDIGQGEGQAIDPDTSAGTGEPVLVDVPNLPTTLTYGTTPITSPFTQIIAIPEGTYIAVSTRVLWTESNTSGGQYFYVAVNGTVVWSINGQSGTVQDPNTSPVLQIGNAPFLAAINAAAGGNVTVTAYAGFANAGSLSPSLIELVLTPVAVVTPSVTFGCETSAPDSNDQSTISITLKNSSGNLTPAPVGGQWFMVAATSGTLSTNFLYLPEGASSGQVGWQGTQSGTATATIIAGAGPCLGQDNCVCSVGFAPPVVIANLSPSSDLCTLNPTRANMRDSIRVMLGLTPPIQYIPGAAAGEEPASESYPGNFVINQAISDAIRTLNRRVGFNSSIAQVVYVPPVTGDGPQYIPLKGIGGGPYKSLINDVRRAIYKDAGTGENRRLNPRDLAGMDRQRRQFYNEDVGVPSDFVIEAYQIGLLPGSKAGGTLTLYAGMGLLGFCSDTEALDELPIDYQAVLEHLAVCELCRYQADDPNYQAYYRMYAPLAEVGVAEVKRWFADINLEKPVEMTFASRRRNRWR
jgi:hypothetical protein